LRGRLCPPRYTPPARADKNRKSLQVKGDDGAPAREVDWPRYMGYFVARFVPTAVFQLVFFLWCAPLPLPPPTASGPSRVPAVPSAARSVQPTC
jgi:hypothetical protein